MALLNRLSHASVALAGLSALLILSAGTGSASAAVYCKTVGVPRGCIVRPAARAVVVAPAVVVTPVVVAPVVVAPVVVAPRRVAVTPRVGVGAVGVPGNRGGPVNRVGRR